MVVFFSGIGFLLCIAAILNMALWRRKDQTAWHLHNPWPWQTARALDGAIIKGSVWRRKNRGGWQYKSATEADEIDAWMENGPV